MAFLARRILSRSRVLDREYAAAIISLTSKSWGLSFRHGGAPEMHDASLAYELFLAKQSTKMARKSVRSANI